MTKSAFHPAATAVAKNQSFTAVSTNERSPWGWSTIKEAMRWRGPFVFLLILLREMLRPFLYWHAYYIFETDLTRQPVPEPFAHEKVEVPVYTGATISQEAKTDIVSMGELEPAEVDARFKRGDMVVIAYVNGEPTGYEWLCRANGVLELAFGVNWVVRPGEAVRYDKFVLPKWRGRRISTWLHSATVVCARDHGILRTYSSISKVNKQSLSIAKHYRRTAVMTLTLVHVLGIEKTFRKVAGAPFASRFSAPATELISQNKVPEPLKRTAANGL